VPHRAGPPFWQTSSLNFSAAGAPGAVKVGPGVLPPLRVTAGPPVCVHLYFRANDSWLGADDSNPFSFTPAPVATFWAGPGFALGALMAVFSFASVANAGAVSSSIVLGSAASSTSPGSQPKRTVIAPATTDLMLMPALRFVKPGGSGGVNTV